mgnify:CR=1 FL=1
MEKIKVYHYDAFSKIPNKGNPAGVVLDSNALTSEEMQKIALEVGFNETAFFVESDKADLRLRYFTPGHEMNLCGHATMAAIYALKTKGYLGGRQELTIETKAGILPIHISDKEDPIHITMKQAPPEFKEFQGSKEKLASALGITKEDLDPGLPILYGSTGTWTLLVPIRKLETFPSMKPDTQTFPSILTEMPGSSIHPFCLETYHKDMDMHARHFSSPYSGTIEDPVTGTASGVMGAYYASHIRSISNETMNLSVEQGQEIGRDGKVEVRITKRSYTYDVEIVGTAVYVKEFYCFR